MSITTAVLSTKESTVPFWAIQDRRMNNIKNKTRYTQRQITRAIRLQDALRLFYKGTFYDEPSYGTTGISIKVGNPTVIDNPGLAAYEKLLEAEGITRKVSAQGVLYRIKV